MSNHLVQKVASVILILGILISVFMAAQTARALVNPAPAATQINE